MNTEFAAVKNPVNEASVIYLGYDGIDGADGTWRLTANGRFNATNPGVKWMFLAVHIPLLSVVYPGRIQLAPTEWLLHQGIPFVYPIELMYHSLLVIEWDKVPLADVIPREIIAAAKRGQAVILFSLANECPVSSIDTDRGPRSMFDAIRDFSETHDLPPENVLYIEGNLRGDNDYLRWGARRSVGRDSRFRHASVDFCAHLVRQYDELYRRELDVQMTVDAEGGSLSIDVKKSSIPYNKKIVSIDNVLDDLAQNRKRPFRFLCMNFAPRPHRQVVAAFLAERDLSDLGLFSFPSLENLFEDWKKFSSSGCDLESGWNKLKPSLPRRIDLEKTYFDGNFFNQSGIYSQDPYRLSTTNFVTETLFLESDMLFISEKTYKPILQLQPFLLVGVAQSLAWLRGAGYQTYDQLIDESYDAIEDPIARMTVLMSEMERLARFSDQEADDFYREALPIAVHNRDVLLQGGGSFDRCLDDLEARFGA